MLNSDDFEQAGDELLHDNRYLDAAAKFREGLAMYPRALDLWEGLIYSLYNAQENLELAVAFRQYSALGGQDLTARTMYAIALSALGKESDAMVEIASVADEVVLDPADGYHAIYCLRGIIEDNVKMHRPAARLGLRLAHRLAEREPDNPEPHFWIGFWIVLNGGPNSDAAPHIEEAVRLDPDNLAFRLYYAKLLDTVGQEQEAFAQYERVPIDQTHEVYLDSRARLCDAYGKPADAQACRRRLRAIKARNRRKPRLEEALKDIWETDDTKKERRPSGGS